MAPHLHGSIINNHVFDLDPSRRVVLSNLFADIQKEPITLLHNVCLVNDGDLFATILEGKVKGISGNALGFSASHDLEGFDNARDGGVFFTRVLSFGVLTNNSQVDILVSGLPVTGQIADKGDGGKDIQVLSETDVDRGPRETSNRSVEETFSTVRYSFISNTITEQKDAYP